MMVNKTHIYNNYQCSPNLFFSLIYCLNYVVYYGSMLVLLVFIAHVRFLNDSIFSYGIKSYQYWWISNADEFLRLIINLFIIAYSKFKCISYRYLQFNFITWSSPNLPYASVYIDKIREQLSNFAHFKTISFMQFPTNTSDVTIILISTSTK